MDLPSKVIYDAFTNEIWEDLGPLDSNWFDALTAETFTNVGSEDQDDLCANQEGNFKTPLDKTAVESQLFSTPKVFRHSRIVSPETEDDHSFTAEQEKETLPWTTTSPYLFRMSKERLASAKSHGVLPTEDSLDLLHTPQKSPTVFAKRITESLGAQMNHDISWTSSLNTPPAVPSTLILTRKEEEDDSSPLSLSSAKNVVIVRKLFPSLSNAFRVEAQSPKNNVCTVQEGGVSLEAAQYPELNESPQTSLNQGDGVWKQKLPDAIEDEEVRSTVASVLDGAENALSIFFTNSHSALRKVKTERIKRRQIIPTKEDGSGSMDLQNSSASNEQRKADQEPGRVPVSPDVKKTANTEIVGSTQWSPLNLSEIPHISVDTSCHDDVTGKLSDANILAEQSLSYSESGKLVRQYLKMTDSGMAKKRRCFVYTIKSSKLPQQGQEIHSENSASSPGIHITGQELSTVQIRNAPDEAKRCSINKNISEEKNLIQKCENITEENLPPTAHLDMSQLCIAFAQDFSQMSDPVKRSSVADDAVSNGFSPSACLSALKRAKQKTRQERLHRDCESVSNSALTSTINQNISISEGTISDSGFQSAVTEITRMSVSSSALPCSEKDGQQKTDFQTQINKMCPFPPKNTGNGQGNVSDSLQKAEMCAELPATVTECKTLGSDGESKLNSSKLSRCTGGDGGRINSLSSERTVSFPSALASGFKTASNKALHISSVSLEKAKHLLDATGDERTLTEQLPVCNGDIKNEFSTNNGLKKDTTCNSNNPPSDGRLEDISCHLTASQKADVRELCSLLEEDDSQFEFTQFKATDLNQQCQDNGISSQKADKELDPDFLNGIDFDDSFSSDAEKSLPVKMTFDKYQTSDITSKPSDVSLSNVMSKEKSSTGDTDFTSEGSERMTSFNAAGHDETNKADNKSSSMFCEGFKSARGSVLKVSKKCLSKARALFADLEANYVTDKKLIDVPLRKSEQRCGVVLSTSRTELKLSSNDNHCAVASREVTGIRDNTAPISLEFSKMTTTTSQSGFKMASGKGICISAKAMKDAKTLFKDCDLVDQKNGSLVKHITGSDKNTISKSENVQGVKEIISEDLRKNKGSGMESVTDEHGGHLAETLHNDPVKMYKAGSNHSPVLRHSNSLHGNLSAPAEPLSSPMCPASGNTYSSAVEGWNNGNVFCTASGKKLSVSAAAMEKAKSLLNEVDICEETNKQPIPKDNLSKTGNLTNHIERLPPQNSGFKTARGKGVIISPAALKKAKSLLSECDKPDHKSSMNQPHPKLSVNGPLPSDKGFLAASGKPVAILAEALQKAKALLGDISFTAETPAASETTAAKPEHGQTNTEKFQKGFKTAGGAKVYLCDDGGTSTNSLQRVDDCIKQLDVLHSSDNVSEKPPAAGSGSAGKKRMENTERPKIQTLQQTAKGCTNGIGPVVTHERLQHHNDDEITDSSISTNAPSLNRQSFLPQNAGSGFCTASGKKVSISDEAMAKATLILNENPTFEEISTKENYLLPHNSRFKTASGKGVIISPASLNKAKCLLNECDEAEDKSSMNQTHPKHTVNALPPKNSGFQTAAGRRVSVSVSALQKAQSLLSEFNAVGDETSLKQTYPKVPVNAPPPRNNGFLSASGKPVAFSAEALQKAKALFDDMSFTTEMPAASDVKKSEEKLPNNTEKIQCGFTTAGGAKVHVPKKHLEKVKHLWKDFFDGDCPDSDSYILSSKDPSKSDPLKVKYFKENSSLVSVGEKNGPTEDIHPHEDESYRSLHEINCANKVPQVPSICSTDKYKIPANMEDCEINQTSSSETQSVLKTKHSSVVNIPSSVCNGCTETQQKFLAQEALDCTLALLEDERLAGQSLTVNLENISLQNDPKTSLIPVGAKKGTGKRAVEDSDLTVQPPLKRQLLEEFDRTVNKPNRSALHPEKSCPYGVMNDRRVFKYSVSLHPNITKTPGSGKNHVETKLQKPTTQSVAQHPTPADSRSAHVKVSAFVPPFLNNTKTQAQKNNVHKDNRRTPSVFVPPFKKQRAVVQDSSFNPLKDEEQQNHVTVTTSDSNTCLVLANKTQNIMGVADNKSKEDLHTQGLSDSTNTNSTCQYLLGSCGTETSAETASNVTDISSRSQEIIQNLQNIELARDMQDMRVRKKKRQTIRPLPGSLFLTKTSKVSRITFTAAVNGKPPARYTQKQLYGYGVHQHVSEITSEAAEAFRFSLLQFLKQEAFLDGGGVQLADGGWLIPSNDGTAGKEEFYRALCDTPGVDPKLVSEEWVYNHYRWIVWKLASMERSFPVTMGSLCLTPEQVLLQLKYRYDVEVDHSCRPALRKIMEKDDTPAKTLVLCVCGIVSSGHSPNKQSRTDPRTPQGVSAKAENSSAVVWLTDGWYAIKAQLDAPLTAMLHKGRLGAGGKLIIHGAQLVGSQDACSPLEAPESLMLKICANSSRPVRWDTKLGFHRDPRPFLLPISSLYSNGGPVGCVDIVILRCYPIQWMERKPDGGVVFRSERAEQKEARRYSSHKQKAMEMVFAKIQAEFENEEKGKMKPQCRRRTVSRQDIARLQDGEELHEAVGDDAAYLEAHLSETQLATLQSYRRSLMEKKQAELQDRYRQALQAAENSEGSCPKRDVTPVWRLSITDSMDQTGSSVYQLNLWQPTSDLQSVLKEGRRYKVYNLTTSDGKKRGGSSSVQLTATKKTQFQDVQASQEWLSACFQPRVSASFVDLQNPDFQPLCREVDLTGFIISVIDEQGSSPAFYLADERLNFIKIRCFSSFAQSGVEDIVKPRVLLALSNLQLRGQSMSPTPVVYAGDLTVFSTNPKEVHLQKSLSHVRDCVQAQGNFFVTAEEKLSRMVTSDGFSAISSPALQPTTASTAERRQDAKTNVTSQQPNRSLGAFTPVSRNPAPPNSSTEKDPKTRKRRRALDYLSRIPSPPPLPHLNSGTTPCVKKTFNPPRRSGTPSTLKTVQTPAPKPPVLPVEDEWVNDEELAMIDTQKLCAGDLP